MENHLFVSKSQADAVRGNYGRYSAIEPIPLPDGTYIVPERCMNDPDLVDAKPALQTMTGNTQVIEELPIVGQPCYSGRTYHYPTEAALSGYSELVICRQTHTRMSYEPYETPALFTFTRPNADNLSWIINEYVYVGWRRIYSAVTYEVIQEHMTQTDWTPPVTLGILWKKPVVPGGPWDVGVAYSINDTATYGGHTYKCLQAHTSQIGWEPPNVPALWEFVS